MNHPPCDRIAFDDLTDYAAGDLQGDAAVALEEHLFSCADCAARAAEFDALVRAVPHALRSAEVGGFVTDAVLNRLAREGVRIRTFVLSPGAIVPCAVWEEDELMVLRLRADFSGAGELTLSQHSGGTELVRLTTQAVVPPHGELIHLTPAALIRQLPEVEIDVVLTASDEGQQREIGRYTLLHGGSLHRR